MTSGGGLGLVGALAVSGTNLYAGGYFDTAGGVTANHIAKWDGNAWSALGLGTGGDDPTVCALAVSGNDLYAGGSFTTAGGVAANHIAKWDGSTWSALGSGMDNAVCELAVDGLGHLLIAGDFFLAGTNVSPYLAQANIMPPEGVIRGIGGGSGSVTLDCLGHPVSTYTVQRATDVQFTSDLATLLTTNAPWPNGLFQWTDNSPPSPSGFYRLRRE